MSNLILLLLCLLLGALFQRLNDFPKNAHLALNSFILYVSLPALSLLYIPQVRLGAEVLYPLGVAWVVFGGGALFIGLAGRWMRLAPPTVGALMLVAGLGNTSFVGLPVLEALYGPRP
jgi:predicted permease